MAWADAGMARIALAAMALLWLTLSASADTLRVATYTTELDRDGPGILLRDIRDGAEDVGVVADVIAAADPDILLLTRFDYDLEGLALAAFADRLADRGAVYPHRFAFPPNSGRPTELDMDGDGYTRGDRDAQGYGKFFGHQGMAILSRYPIDAAHARDFSGLLWRDLPGARLPRVDGAVFPSPQAMAIQRLSTTGHWDVPVTLPSGVSLHLLAFHATPPVFDGPEDRNGLRNADEIRFWRLYLDGDLAEAPPEGPVVVLGNSNLDPAAGDGRRPDMTALLAHPVLQDPKPASAGGAAGGLRPGGVARYDTVAWDAPDEPGNMRVSYVLPDARLHVVDAGVLWPAPGSDAILGEGGRGGSRHRLVWVDLAMPGPGFLDRP